MAQQVNISELSLPQLEVLKNQLDQVGATGGGGEGAIGGAHPSPYQLARAGSSLANADCFLGCGCCQGEGRGLGVLGLPTPDRGRIC